MRSPKYNTFFITNFSKKKCSTEITFCFLKYSSQVIKNLQIHILCISYSQYPKYITFLNFLKILLRYCCILKYTLLFIAYIAVYLNIHFQFESWNTNRFTQASNKSRKKKKTHNKYRIVHSFKGNNDKIQRHLTKIGFLNVVLYPQIFTIYQLH